MAHAPQRRRHRRSWGLPWALVGVIAFCIAAIALGVWMAHDILTEDSSARSANMSTSAATHTPYPPVLLDTRPHSGTH